MAWSEVSAQVMDSVYRRVAAVTGLPEDLVSEQALAESLNVLNYPEGAGNLPPLSTLLHARELVLV